jgi:hypothetical protein
VQTECRMRPVLLIIQLSTKKIRRQDTKTPRRQEKNEQIYLCCIFSSWRLGGQFC